MTPRLWGVPLVATGLVAAGIVLWTGWTCPTGGTGPCPHAYIAGGWLLVLGAGAAIFIWGLVLIAVGRKRSPK